MKLPTRYLGAARMLTLLREIDLGALRNEADRRFTLSISGDLEGARALAERLSATPERIGVHPYIGLTDAPNTDLRVFVTRGPEAPPSHPGLTLTVYLTGGEPLPVGTDLPRPGEVGRVVLTELTETSVRENVIPALLRALPPTLHLALARQLPVFRPAVIRGLIEEAARTNALYAVSTGVAEIVPVLNLPLNVADTVVLTKNQLVMAYKVALAAGRTGSAQDVMTEIVGVLGGGLLFRQVARGLIGLIPVWGVVPKVAVAYAGTQLIGTAAALWATEGREASPDELRALYADALRRGRDVAARLVPERFRRKGRAEVLEEGVKGELEERNEP